ncbi:nickel-dependent hydrogenase large subunit [Roseibium sp.]|uniref:nickel-dependent hydrogenase large subunit n=1 Tax=Roseibium sp. TaxID=1936156 RepID=UPI003B51EA48
MSLEGHLNIVLPRDTDAPISIDLKEPADITKLLIGRSPEAASLLIPSLFSLCGTAHAAAAIQAAETAKGIEPDLATHQIRNCLVLMERAREHLLRISLVWQKIVGAEPDTETAQAALKLLPAFRQAIDQNGCAFSEPLSNWRASDDGSALIACLISLIENRILGETIPIWLDRHDGSALAGWTEQIPTGAARFLGSVLRRNHDEPAPDRPLFLSESGLTEPLETVKEVPETSSYERRRSHPILTQRGMPTLADRYLARLIDLAETAQELYQVFLEVDAPVAKTGNTTKPGVGFAETARGRLTHVVDLQDGKVANYKIISPTRWNFASRGVATRYLDAIPEGPDCARVKHADLVVGAIDPCVAYEVRIH